MRNRFQNNWTRPAREHDRCASAGLRKTRLCFCSASDRARNFSISSRTPVHLLLTTTISVTKPKTSSLPASSKKPRIWVSWDWNPCVIECAQPVPSTSTSENSNEWDSGSSDIVRNKPSKAGPVPTQTGLSPTLKCCATPTPKSLSWETLRKWTGRMRRKLALPVVRRLISTPIGASGYWLWEFCFHRGQLPSYPVASTAGVP